MGNSRVGAVVALSVWLVSAGSAASGPGDDPWYAGTFRVATGIDWSTGAYGADTKTDVLYVPVTVGYRWERFPTPYPWDEFELGVTTAYVRVDGPAILVDGLPVVAPGRDAQARDGVSDVLLQATYRIFAPPAWPLPLLELGARVKLPTADRDQGLGTGEVDATLIAGLAQRVRDVSLFVQAGYRFVGDPPGFDLRNTVQTSVGASSPLWERFGVGLVYDWRQTTVRGASDAHELVPFGWVKLRRALRISPYVVVGLSEGSPDVGVGLQLSVSMPVR